MWFSIKLVFLLPGPALWHSRLAQGPDHTADEAHTATGFNSGHHRAWAQQCPEHSSVLSIGHQAQPEAVQTHTAWDAGHLPMRIEGIQEHTVPMPCQFHSTQMARLPGEPVASA